MKKELSVVGIGIVVDMFGEEKEVNIIPFVCDNDKPVRVRLQERDDNRILIGEDYLFISGMVVSVTEKTTIMDEDEQHSSIKREILVSGYLSEEVINDLQGKVLERVRGFNFSNLKI
jgi:hypothetical protein